MVNRCRRLSRFCWNGKHKTGGRHGRKDVCPLSQAACNGRLRVCRVIGNRQICARMASLGVFPGCELELLCPAQGGRCMVRVNGGTLSLDDLTAESILVSRE